MEENSKSNLQNKTSKASFSLFASDGELVGTKVTPIKPPKSGVDLIAQLEGLKLEAYKCPAGKWTIGYGHTEGVYPNQKITKDQANLMLNRDCEEIWEAIRSYLKVPVSENQGGCLLSFTYNVGRNALKKSSLLEELNKGNYKVIPNKLRSWVYITTEKGRVVSQGLVNRREKEASLWMKKNQLV